jgi:hypothetical protein
MWLTSENKTQTYVVGGKEGYYTSRPAPGYLQNGAGPELRGFYSKKQTWQLAFQGKKYIMSAHLWMNGMQGLCKGEGLY